MMNTGTISNIRVPEGKKIKLSQVQVIKSVPKDESFCEVKVVRHDDQIYALKIIHKKQIRQGLLEEEYRRVQNEIKVLYQLNHPSIIKLYCHQETEDDIMLLMQYGGTRLGSLIRRKQLDEDEVKKLVIKILQAIKVIHENGYIHRDLSVENILVTRQNEVKIIDFGFVDEGRGRRTELGNLVYMAPEINGENNYNHKVDIWSLGVIVYEMFHQDLPFCSRKNFEEKLFVQNREKYKLNLSGQISTEAIDFIGKMLVLNPEKRLEAADLLRHPFIRGTISSTEIIGRKTQKNQYLRDKSGREQKQRSQRDIQGEQRQLKRSIGQVFSCLHHQRDIFADLLKTYQAVLQKETRARKNN